ncbi:peroxiredoxin 1 [Scaptodrosophila lebanonensis]|uniref:thioredoxin-dependent peroxiredoxin n=1 Tax=Drosophila lebanonensis TaxID=7225 RepID=A0A6J2TRK1_DROLE|nr:peroxiredoxin 1 [Scaptodrosophila lebanonensis]
MSLIRMREAAPDFNSIALVNGCMKPIALTDFRGKYVIMLFYPAAFSNLCPTELHAFSDRAQEFRTVNCEIIACSTDSIYVHTAWAQMPRNTGGLGEMDIALMTDKSMKISQAYGVLDEATGMAHRALFIIDREGLVRQITINDLHVGRNVDEALRLVQAFQFTDEFGEVCPVNWKPGHKAIKPDSAGKEEYFKYAN